MLKSVLLICFFILLLNEASVQEVVVQGFIGGSAVLPCHPGNRSLARINAHWRYDDRKNVYDILNGMAMTKEQDPEYKGRTVTFPAEYSKGNFSLKLGSLQKSDEGSYCCFIPELGLNECVNLQVKEKPIGIQKPGSNGGVETTAGRIVSLLIPLFSVTLQL
ncbi:CD276 antigen-like isoform X1 [Carassius gibelio]|uniref:CD276 antigen-like isoform X1 n=1 Tax=Carassius gibelio TaxID=101364 RepID=UPI002277C3FD|nr:CD276 antigen-like isoform X1 [Carassius gibelio]